MLFQDKYHACAIPHMHKFCHFLERGDLKSSVCTQSTACLVVYMCCGCCVQVFKVLRTYAGVACSKMLFYTIRHLLCFLTAHFTINFCHTNFRHSCQSTALPYQKLNKIIIRVRCTWKVLIGLKGASNPHRHICPQLLWVAKLMVRILTVLYPIV